MRGVLVQIEAWSRILSARVTVRVGGALNASTLGAGGVVWEPVLTRRPRFAMQLADADITGTLAVGTAEFAFNVSALRNVADAMQLDWVGSPVTIYSGDSDRLADLTVEFTGRVAGGVTSPDNSVAPLALEVDKSFVDVPLLTKTYGGGGGADGDVEIRGTNKPAGYGRPVNIRPVLVKSTSAIYQVDGYSNLVDIPAIYEDLASFGAPIADYANFAALDAAVIPEGRWATCIAEGFFRLGADAVGTITADLVCGGGRPGSMMLRWLRAHAGVPEARIRAADFDTLTATVAATVGGEPAVSFWTTDSNNVLDLMQRMCGSCNAVPLLMLDGTFTVSSVIGGDVLVDLDRQGSNPPVTAWQSSDPPLPWWRMRMVAARSYYVNPPSEIDYEDDIIDLGDWSATETYRRGNVVRASDNARYLYINEIPAAGIDPTTDDDDSHWTIYEVAPDATKIKYGDGSTVEDRQPAEKGADVTGNNKSKDTDAVGGRPSNLVLAEADAARDGIADLIETLGSTESAAAAADAAALAATNAQTARDDSRAARDAAQQARDLAGTKAGLADTAMRDAQTARDAAQGAQGLATQQAGLADTARQQAQAARTDAQNARQTAIDNAYGASQSAEGAAGSASTASGKAEIATQKATDADTSASLAMAKADIATSASGQAGLYADAAARSESNASGFASAAYTSSTVSASAKEAAKATVSATLPSDFAQGYDYWTYDSNQSPANAPYSPGSIYVAPGVGNVWRNSSSASYDQVLTRNGFVPVPGRTYEIEASHRVFKANDIAGSNSGFGIYFVFQNTSWQEYSGAGDSNVPGYVSFGNNSPVTPEFITLKSRWTCPASGVPAYVRARFHTNFGAGLPAGNATHWLRSLKVADVTSEAASGVSANAAALSSSSAAASKHDAEESASASQRSETNAATSAGDAKTYRNDASLSANNAYGSEQTASQQAGVATQARSDAQGAATAASGSASTATTKASDAGLYAEAADASRQAAQTAKGQAESYRDSAAASESNAAGSASSASQSAGVSATARDAAKNAVGKTFPSGFTPAERQFWTYDAGVNTDDPLPYPDDWFGPADYPVFVTRSGLSAVIASRARFIPVKGRRYRTTLTIAKLNDLGVSGSSSIYLAYIRSDGTNVSFPSVTTINGAQIPYGWQEFATEWLCEEDYVWARPRVHINSDEKPIVYHIKSLKHEDITESQTSKIAAQASADSASAASASKGAAGEFASAADRSATNAATSASDADTYRSQASQASTTAQGSASTATQQAGVAARSSFAAANKNLIRQSVFASGQNSSWRYATGGAPLVIHPADFNQTPPDGGYALHVQGHRDTFEYVLNAAGSYELAWVEGKWGGRKIRVAAHISNQFSGRAVAFGLRGQKANNEDVYLPYFITDPGAHSDYRLFEDVMTVPDGVVRLVGYIFLNGNDGENMEVRVQDFRAEDVTSEAAAEGSAVAAAGSASTASTKSDEAGQSASAAHADRVDAETAKGQAQGYATLAATSEQSALGSKNAAAISSGVSASARDVATKTAAKLLPSGFTPAEHLFWTYDAGAQSDSPGTYGDDWFGPESYPVFVTRAGGSNVIASAGRLTPVKDRSYRTTLTITKVSGGTATSNAYFGWIVYNGSDFLYPNTPFNGAALASGWQTIVCEWTCNGEYLWMRPRLHVNVEQTDAVYHIKSIKHEDITESASAKGFAEASALSQSLASASKTAAGESASAAHLSEVNAKTSEGSASGYATQAATAKTDAESAANTASSSAGLVSQLAGSALSVNIVKKGAFYKANDTGLWQAEYGQVVFRPADFNQPSPPVGPEYVYQMTGREAVEGNANANDPKTNFVFGNWGGRKIRVTGYVWTQFTGAQAGLGMRALSTTSSGYSIDFLYVWTPPNMIGWQPVDGIIQLPSTTVAVIPSFLHDVPGGYTGPWAPRFANFRLADVTDSETARGYASAALSSAQVATTKEDAAGKSATTADTRAQAALTSQNGAFQSAKNAADSATAASASEASTFTLATQSSQFGFSATNKNPVFAAPGWPNPTAGQNLIVPPQWSQWANDQNFSSNFFIGPIDGAIYGSRALRINRTGTNVGILQGGLGTEAAGWYVLESELRVTSGVWQGTGMHVNFGNGQSHNFSFGAEADTVGVVNGGDYQITRTFSKLIRKNDIGGSGTLYLMAGWDQYGSSSYAETTWFKGLIRKASQGEIDSGVAKTAADAATASITEVRSTITNAGGALGSRLTTIEATAGGLTSRVTTAETAIATMGGKLTAYWRVEASVPGGRAQLSVYADSNGGGGVDIIGDLTISGNAITKGQIRNADNSVSLDLNGTNGLYKIVKSGYRFLLGAAFGYNGDLVMWYGPDNVTPQTETKTNGVFAMATDGKVYKGNAELVNGGGGGGRTPEVRSIDGGLGSGQPYNGDAIVVTLDPGQSIAFEAQARLTSQSGNSNVTLYIQYALAGEGGYTDNMPNPGTSYVGEGEPGFLGTSGSVTNNYGDRRTFKVHAHLVAQGSGVLRFTDGYGYIRG